MFDKDSVEDRFPQTPEWDKCEDADRGEEWRRKYAEAQDMLTKLAVALAETDPRRFIEIWHHKASSASQWTY